MCINLDGCQNKGGNFLNLLQKVGLPKKRGGGSLRKEGSSNPGGNYDIYKKIEEKIFYPKNVNTIKCFITYKKKGREKLLKKLKLVRIVE